jgi:curved DNA-binding protein
VQLDAQGRPQVVNRTLSVKIPVGIRAGQMIRLAGQGMPGEGAPQPVTCS